MNGLIIHTNIYEIQECSGRSFAILYINRGSTAVVINGLKITAAAPFCFCLNEKEVVKIIESRNLSMTQILFSPDYINSGFDFHNLDPAAETLPRSAELDKFYMLPFTDRGNGYNGWFSPDPELNETMRRKIKSLLSDYADRKSPFHPCRQRSSFLDLLLFLCRNYRLREPDSDDDSLVEKVISFFTENYQEKITIAGLCSRFGTNRNTLARKFRQEKCATVMESLAAVRINMAASLLRSTMLPVADILFRVGFNDTAHFGRTFKKLTGVSPSEYRKSSGTG